MLKRALLSLAATTALVASATSAHGQDEEKDGLRRPERLTVGVADQFLGQLAPDKKTLYFSSNRNTTNEIYSQNVDDGRAHLLFDEGAEVTWPRVSPDGKSILYVSYSDRATGQLCVRDLPSGKGRRCLEDGSAALLAEWIDAKRIVLVARTSIDGDLRVHEVNAGSRLSTRPILDRNISSPAVSPDGKWLVYVPVERSSDRVGPAFAAHAAQRLEAVRLDRPGTPLAIPIDVPGLTGQPAFSKDGRYLYFVQFFSDSNRDGVVDGSDHGVLFRVPLSFGQDGQGAPVVGAANQLTDESWNCQYPAPAADRLVTTCSRGRNLDLYSLPLDGEVPSDWTTQHLADEIELASKHSKLQLLYYERLARSTTPSSKRFVKVRLVRTHLALEEFGAAEFYAKHIAAAGDPDSLGLSQPLLVLVDHRKALRQRERGRIVENFDERARARMASLEVKPGDTSAAAALTRVVRSEIADTIGDKARARAELEAAPIAGKTPRAVLEAYYEQADALYRELDDREALVTACRQLALHPQLAEEDRLRYARAAVRAMVRGLPYADAEARLERERATAPADSELAFALSLGRALLTIRDARPGKAAKAVLVEMYQKETRIDRRRAIMLDAVQRATQYGADPIIEGLAEHYVDSVDAAAQERRRAERLYTQVIVGRAFRRRAAQKYDEARADFEAVAKRTGSLEAVVGAIDLRLRAGESTAAIRAEYDARRQSGEVKLANFVTAYLLSCDLRKLEGDEHGNAVSQAIAALKASWSELKKQCMAQSLYGALQHAEYLRTRDLALAEKAGTHYLVALELVGTNQRYKAMVLGQLGLLHTEVGNYRIALAYLQDRDRLPYAENSEGFAVRLAKARCHLHVGHEKDAADEADEALAMTESAQRLAQYRILALDRAALYNLSANRFERALALYDEELKRLESDASPMAARNRFVARLARAAAALGAEQPNRALADLDAVDRGLSDPGLSANLGWPHATNEQVVRSYRLITSGLRARTLQKIGQLDGAARSLETRRALLEAELAATGREEFVRLLALLEAQRADIAIERRDEKTAAAALKKALEHADNLHDLSKGAVDRDQLDVLWLAAQSNVLSHTPVSSDLPNRLGKAGKLVSTPATPVNRSYARMFEIYETLTGPLVKGDSHDAPASPPPAGERDSAAAR
ncbi:hypothetical protein AKJ09_07071 [Labilithrix luteola]|uniref:Uncharacterized protein n=1 Tax=Labilithrix luteola TaxID=1391654 RepID=A0A0K1Q3T1_9BACT|nr:PD40 domain-containing protein [Labilithrix luteola]AKV00408.1 hypothetical protein AKJ09_07071 [Labilithrix luteola]